MRDDRADTVTPGGRPAPLGARGGTPGRAGPLGGASVPVVGGPEPRGLAGLGLSTTLLVVLLAVSLAGYAVIAADVVHTGPLARIDPHVAAWVASSMPAFAEWAARPFTWVGGAVGLTVVVAATALWLLGRRARLEAALACVVMLGIQLLVAAAKSGYARPRPDVGSAIALPSSFSFPSGHAAGGIAVFGLLGLYAAAVARTRRRRLAAIGAGFALGALVGASRVVLGVHYVTDVVAGAFIGLAWLAACLLLALRLRR